MALSSLMSRTSAWASQSQRLGLDPTNFDVMLSTASTFAFLCGPDDRSARALDIAARFLFLFFCFDDLPVAQLPDLKRPRDEWPCSPLVDALVAWEADFDEIVQSPAHLQARFRHGFYDNISALGHERELKGAILTVENHWIYRRRSIFMNPYIDLWLISCGIDTIIESHPAISEARRLVIDLVLLSNDLGSVERDSPSGLAPDDLNLIPTYMRAYGWAQDEAIEKLTDLHNTMVAQCRDILLSVDHRNANARRYGDILAGIADGNIAALEVLPQRYPGIVDRVQRLDTVLERPRPRWS